jgi:hypothetical protein
VRAAAKKIAVRSIAKAMTDLLTNRDDFPNGFNDLKFKVPRTPFVIQYDYIQLSYSRNNSIHFTRSLHHFAICQPLLLLQTENFETLKITVGIAFNHLNKHENTKALPCN